MRAAPLVHRPLALVMATATACAPISDAAIDLDGIETVLVIGGVPTRARAFASTELSDSPLISSTRTATTLHLFGEDRATLGLVREPEVLVVPRCPADTLDTATADRSLCWDGAAYLDCGAMTARRHLAKIPYLTLGDPLTCEKWRIRDRFSRTDFNLELGGARAESGALAVALDDDRVLLGQRTGSTTTAVGRRTVLQLLDTTVTTGGASLVGPPIRIEGWIATGVYHSEDKVWLAQLDGRLQLFDIATGTATTVVGRSPAGDIADIARSPTDPSMVAAVTDHCAILRRDGASWAVISPPIVATGFEVVDPKHPCAPRIVWADPDEAVIVAIALSQPRNTTDLFAASRKVVRLRGGQLSVESVDDSESFAGGRLTAVARYPVPGGHVEVAAGLVIDDRDPTLLGLLDSSKVLYVRDSRLGASWTRIPDGDPTKATPLLRMIPWDGGLFGVGGYAQAFDDEHWRAEPRAAISGRIGFGDGREYTEVASDGHGGVVAAMGRLGESQVHFSWWRARPGR